MRRAARLRPPRRARHAAHLPAPLDVLAQQIVAESACREWNEDELFALVRRAWPYASLDACPLHGSGAHARRRLQRSSGQPPRYVHRDAVNRLLRERRARA
jgi:ATP-dependent Lhr-like helicase